VIKLLGIYRALLPPNRRHESLRLAQTSSNAAVSQLPFRFSTRTGSNCGLPSENRHDFTLSA